MPRQFFTSDLHLGHGRILEFEPESRNFRSIESHNRAIVDHWNSVVRSAKDVVWVLGDVAWNKTALAMLKQMNGIKKLVLGDHDHLAATTYLEYFTRLHGVVELKDGLLLSHTPIHPREFDFGIRLNLHGHLHSRAIADPRYFNVSMDRHGLKPVAESVIQSHLSGLK